MYYYTHPHARTEPSSRARAQAHTQVAAELTGSTMPPISGNSPFLPPDVWAPERVEAMQTPWEPWPLAAPPTDECLALPWHPVAQRVSRLIEVATRRLPVRFAYSWSLYWAVSVGTAFNLQRATSTRRPAWQRHSSPPAASLAGLLDSALRRSAVRATLGRSLIPRRGCGAAGRPPLALSLPPPFDEQATGSAHDGRAVARDHRAPRRHGWDLNRHRLHHVAYQPI